MVRARACARATQTYKACKRQLSGAVLWNSGSVLLVSKKQGAPRQALPDAFADLSSLSALQQVQGIDFQQEILGIGNAVCNCSLSPLPPL